MPKPRFQLGTVVALTWLLLAVAATVLLGPRLGLRGWAWLCVHHSICLLGCGHELRKRFLQRRAQG